MNSSTAISHIGSPLRTAFERDGYLRIERLASESELAVIDEIFARVVRSRFGRSVESHVDRSRGGFDASIVTVVAPEADAPELMQTAVVESARRVLMEVFDAEPPAIAFDCRLFFKPPGSPATPWHQDAANRPRPHAGGSVWIALDDALGASAALCYLPGTHRDGLRPHAFDADHFHTSPPDLDRIVSASVPRGGATVHHCLTLHSSTSNDAEYPRRALVVVAQLRAGAVPADTIHVKPSMP